MKDRVLPHMTYYEDWQVAVVADPHFGVCGVFLGVNAGEVVSSGVLGVHNTHGGGYHGGPIWTRAVRHSSTQGSHWLRGLWHMKEG